MDKIDKASSTVDHSVLTILHLNDLERKEYCDIEQDKNYSLMQVIFTFSSNINHANLKKKNLFHTRVEFQYNDKLPDFSGRYKYVIDQLPAISSRFEH